MCGWLLLLIVVFLLTGPIGVLIVGVAAICFMAFKATK